MKRIRCRGGRLLQCCEGLRKLLPRSDLPGAQQKTPCNLNRYVLLLVYIVGVGCTGPVFFNWPPLAELLFRNEAFVNLCKKDPVSGVYTPDLRVRRPREQYPSSDGAAGSGSTGQEESRQDQKRKTEEGGKPYVCDAQETAVQQLYTLCCAICCCFCGIAGALMDACGPRLTSVAGRLLQMVGWLLLAFADTVSSLYYVGLAFIASGTEAAVLPTISVCRLFPASEGFIITIVGSALSVSYAVPLVMKHFVEAYGQSFRTISLSYAFICPLMFSIVALFLMPIKNFQHLPAEKLELPAHDWGRGDGNAAAASVVPAKSEVTDERDEGVHMEWKGETGKRVTIMEEDKERDETDGKGVESRQRRRERATHELEGKTVANDIEQRRDGEGQNDEEEKKKEEKRKGVLSGDAEQKSSETYVWWRGSSSSTKGDGRSGSSSSNMRSWYNNNTQQTEVECATVDDSIKLTSRLNRQRRRHHSSGSVRRGNSRKRSTNGHPEMRLSAGSVSSNPEDSHNTSTMHGTQLCEDQSPIKMPASESERVADTAAHAAVGEAVRSTRSMQHCRACNGTSGCWSGDEFQISQERDTCCGAAGAPASNSSYVSAPVVMSRRTVLTPAGGHTDDEDIALRAAADALIGRYNSCSARDIFPEATVADCATGRSPAALPRLLSGNTFRDSSAVDGEAVPVVAVDASGCAAGPAADAAHSGAAEKSGAQHFRREGVYTAVPVVDVDTKRPCSSHSRSDRTRETATEIPAVRYGQGESMSMADASSSAVPTVYSAGDSRIVATGSTIAAVNHGNANGTANNVGSGVAVHTTATADERKTQEQSVGEGPDGLPNSRKSRNRQGSRRRNTAEAAPTSEVIRTSLEGVTVVEPRTMGTSPSRAADDMCMVTISKTPAPPVAAEAASSATTRAQAVCCHVLRSEDATTESERVPQQRNYPLLQHPKATACVNVKSELTAGEERENTSERGSTAAPIRCERVTEESEVKQQTAAPLHAPGDSTNMDAPDGCGCACYRKTCCCCPLMCKGGSRACVNWLRQLNNKNVRSSIQQLISERYLLILVYKIVVVLVATYFQQAGHRMFSEAVLKVRGLLLPFSFVPCIILGQAADHFGIVRVLFVMNFFGFSTYFFSFFSGYSVVWAYLSVCCFTCYMSFYSSQVFIYIEETFMPEHFGKLSGFSLMAGGITSLATHPLYSYLTVSIHGGNTVPVRIALTVPLLLLYLLLLRLLILYKRNPQPYRSGRELSEHSDNDKDCRSSEVLPTVVGET